MGGIKPGKQLIIAARPSVGKSSFAEQICLNLARDGHACAFLSQEMSNDELADRAVANLGRVGLDRLATGKLVGDEWARLTDGVEALRTMPLYFDEQAGLSLSDIRAKARMLKRQHGVKVIVLDYLQLCASSKAGDSRHHQLEELSRGLKNLAKELELTFISLSQLNREVEKRTNGRPVLSDLKESGAIEEDADVVILLSRNGDQKIGPRQIVCDVPKNRQGRVGELCLIFDGEHQRWSESVEPFQCKPPARSTTRMKCDDRPTTKGRTRRCLHIASRASAGVRLVGRSESVHKKSLSIVTLRRTHQGAWMTLCSSATARSAGPLAGQVHARP